MICDARESAILIPFYFLPMNSRMMQRGFFVTKTRNMATNVTLQSYVKMLTFNPA